LKLPAGNFTNSYGGAKCSGQLVTMKGAFDALDKYKLHVRQRLLVRL
jgi:hypothetical protein